MNIIITGASKGLGAETAMKLAVHKEHALILISRDKVKLNTLKSDIQSINKDCRCETYIADLSSEEEILYVTDKISKYYNSIDILINNAGYLSNKPFDEISLSEINKTLMINFIAPALLCRLIIPLMGKERIGHIINIGSMGGYQGSVKFPGLSVYSSAKGALAILTECLAEEYKSKRIRINCLALGSADTEMLREAFPGYKSALSASEMAEFIAHFALTGHRYFNGKILPVSFTSP